MINTNRIVSVLKTDLLTLYGNILTIAGKTLTAIPATNPGEFSLENPSGSYIASEPVMSMDFTGTIDTAEIYFLASYDFEGFKIDGADATLTGTVDADASTLYKCVPSDSGVTVTKVGF